MKMWSAGLGSEETALVLDFTKASFKREGDKVIVTGIVVEPVNWEYKLTLMKEDVPGLLWVILSIPVLRYFARNISGVWIYIREKFIRRRMGREERKSVERESETKESESAAS